MPEQSRPRLIMQWEYISLRTQDKAGKSAPTMDNRG